MGDGLLLAASIATMFFGEILFVFSVPLIGIFFCYYCCCYSLLIIMIMMVIALVFLKPNSFVGSFAVGFSCGMLYIILYCCTAALFGE